MPPLEPRPPGNKEIQVPTIIRVSLGCVLMLGLVAFLWQATASAGTEANATPPASQIQVQPEGISDPVPMTCDDAKRICCATYCACKKSPGMPESKCYEQFKACPKNYNCPFIQLGECGC